MHNPQVEVITPYTPKEICGADGVTTLVVEERDGQACRELKVKGVFVFVGLTPQTEFVNGVLERDAGGFIVTAPDMATPVPGIFAAGDCRANFAKQIVVSAGEGSVAAIRAERFLQTLKIPFTPKFKAG